MSPRRGLRAPAALQFQFRGPRGRGSATRARRAAPRSSGACRPSSASALPPERLPRARRALRALPPERLPRAALPPERLPRAQRALRALPPERPSPSAWPPERPSPSAWPPERPSPSALPSEWPSPSATAAGVAFFSFGDGLMAVKMALNDSQRVGSGSSPETMRSNSVVVETATSSRSAFLALDRAMAAPGSSTFASAISSATEMKMRPRAVTLIFRFATAPFHSLSSGVTIMPVPLQTARRIPPPQISSSPFLGETTMCWPPFTSSLRRAPVIGARLAVRIASACFDDNVVNAIMVYPFRLALWAGFGFILPE